MGFVDSGSVLARVGLGAAAVGTVGLIAGGLWWDQARVDEAVAKATAAMEEQTVEPRQTAAEVDRDKATTTSPKPKPAPKPESEAAADESPAPEPDSAADPVPAAQVVTQQAVPSAPAVQVAPVSPAAPRVAAPVQAPVVQEPVVEEPVVQAPPQSPAGAGEQDAGTPAEGGEQQTDTGGEQQSGNGTDTGIDADTVSPNSPVRGGGTILDQLFNQLAR